jgi:hypothetical protein
MRWSEALKLGALSLCLRTHDHTTNDRVGVAWSEAPNHAYACRGRLRAGRLGHRTCYYGFNDRTFSMPVCQRRALSHLHRAAHRGNSVRCPYVDAAEAKVVRAQRSLGRRATQQDLPVQPTASLSNQAPDDSRSMHGHRSWLHTAPSEQPMAVQYSTQGQQGGWTPNLEQTPALDVSLTVRRAAPKIKKKG